MKLAMFIIGFLTGIIVGFFALPLIAVALNKAEKRNNNKDNEDRRNQIELY